MSTPVQGEPQAKTDPLHHVLRAIANPNRLVLVQPFCDVG